MSDNNLNELVEKLFDWDVEDDSFLTDIENASATELATAIKEVKKERGWRENIRIPVDMNDDVVNTLLIKLEEMRTTLEDKEFKEVWNALIFTNEYSVWGGATWGPKIFHNGGVAIRNHHRVIALDESPVGELSLDNEKIKNDISELVTRLDELKEEEDNVWSFGILHRDSEGAVWTNKVPDELSKYGQTLIFVQNNILEKAKELNILSDDNFLNEYNISEAAENSRSGHAVIRVFKDRSFIYSTHRASDDYDTILEVHANYLGEDYDEDVFPIRIEGNGVTTKEIIKEDLADMDFSIFSYDALEGKDELKELIEKTLYGKYADEKAQQTSHFTPFFSYSHDAPGTYWNNMIPLLEASRSEGGKTFNMLMSATVIKSFETFEDDIRNAIYASVEIVDPKEVKVYLSTEENQKLNSVEVYDVDSPPYKEALEAMKVRMIESYSEAYETDPGEDEDTENEFFTEYGYENQFAVMYILDENVNILDAHTQSLKVSRELENSLSLVVPSIGLYQGYCEGELDTGNNLVFLTQDDMDSVDLDDDDWDNDEDDDYSI